MDEKLDVTQNTDETQIQETEGDNSDQVSQISDMMAAFDPATTAEKEEVTEDKSEDKEDKEEKETEDKEETEETEELSPQDKRIAELEAVVAELKEKLSNPNPSQEPTTQEQQSTEDEYFKTKLEEVQKDLVSEYVSEDDYEAVFEKREKLNEVLKRVQSDTLQGVFRSIPKIIASIIPQHVMLYSKTAEFYKANPDLIEHRQKVGEVIDQVAAKNPKWKLDEVLEHVGGKPGDENDLGAVRKMLGLKKKAEKKAEQTNVRRPSFAKPSHPKQPGKEVTLQGLDKEIDEMIKANT